MIVVPLFVGTIVADGFAFGYVRLWTGSVWAALCALDLVEAVGRYEAKMIKYGFDAVLKSREQMTDEDPIHKLVIGRIALALMRTAMRVTNYMRPLRERMAHSMLQYRGAGRDNADFVLPARSSRPVAN